MNSWRFRDSIGALVVARVMRAAATNAQLPSLTNLTAAGARRPCPAPGHDRIVVRIVRIRAPGRRCPDGSCERRHGHGQADARAVRSVARRLDLTFPDGPSLFAWLARVLPGTMACLQDGHVTIPGADRPGRRPSPGPERRFCGAHCYRSDRRGQYRRVVSG